MKKELLDLYFVLKKRNVSLEEWLKFHELNSVEAFAERADEIAARIDCMISDKMRSDVLNLLKPKEESLVESVKPTENMIQNVDAKRKTKVKKSSSNVSPDVVKLDTSESLIDETSLKEKSNENSE